MKWIIIAINLAVLLSLGLLMAKTTSGLLILYSLVKSIQLDYDIAVLLFKPAEKVQQQWVQYITKIPKRLLFYYAIKSAVVMVKTRGEEFSTEAIKDPPRVAKIMSYLDGTYFINKITQSDGKKIDPRNGQSRGESCTIHRVNKRRGSSGSLM